MFIPTNERLQIAKYILQEGCLLLKEDIMALHPELEIQNLKVRSMATSFTDKGWLKRVFVWRHGYYTLTAEGHQKLSELLCVESAIINEIIEAKEEGIATAVEE
ncbi:hypothetical protein COBT_000345 [Conglomerata obtusa]